MWNINIVTCYISRPRYQHILKLLVKEIRKIYCTGRRDFPFDNGKPFVLNHFICVESTDSNEQCYNVMNNEYYSSIYKMVQICIIVYCTLYIVNVYSSLELAIGIKYFVSKTFQCHHTLTG